MCLIYDSVEQRGETKIKENLLNATECSNISIKSNNAVNEPNDICHETELYVKWHLQDALTGKKVPVQVNRLCKFSCDVPQEETVDAKFTMKRSCDQCPIPKPEIYNGRLKWKIDVEKFRIRKKGNEYQGIFVKDVVSNDVIQIGEYLRLEYSMANTPKE